MEVILASSLPELLDLVIFQFTSNDVFQLLLADLLLGLLRLRGLVARLEASLHADAKCSVEGNIFCVSAHVGSACRGLVNAEDLFALSLQREGSGVVRYGDDEELLFGRDGGRVRIENAVLVAAQVSAEWSASDIEAV